MRLLTVSEEIGLVHSLTAHELTVAASTVDALGYEGLAAKLTALRDALYPEEGKKDGREAQ